jgi:AcrR family transcriptional regulator
LETVKTFWVFTVEKQTKDQSQRNVILDVAFEKFRKHGIRRVTLEEIARELRISKKTIYQHFPDKKAMVSACVERIVTEIIPVVEKALNSRETVTQRVFDVWQALAVIPRQVTSEFLADLKADYSYIWEDIDRRRHEVFAGWEKLFADGIASGEIRPEIHPKVALRIMLSVLENVITPDVLATGEFTPAQAFETFFQILNRGIFTRPASRRRKETRA